MFRSVIYICMKRIQRYVTIVITFVIIFTDVFAGPFVCVLFLSGYYSSGKTRHFCRSVFSITIIGCLKNDTFNYELFSGLSPTPESFFLARCSAKNASSYSWGDIIHVKYLSTHDWMLLFGFFICVWIFFDFKKKIKRLIFESSLVAFENYHWTNQ